MGDEDAKALAAAAASEAVRLTFARLGVDIDKAEEVRTFQANAMWVYRARHLSERVGSAILIAAATALVTALGWLIVQGAKVATKGG